MKVKSKIGAGVNLTIQIVNFRSRDCLASCLLSIAQNLSAWISAEVVIINNDDEDLDEMAECFRNDPVCRVIELNQNVGFGRAHNLGLKSARGEYVLFLNPDTKVLPGALGSLLDTFSKNEKAGMVGPLLVGAGGEIQPDCFGARKTPFSMIGEKIYSFPKTSVEASDKALEVDWVSGGAMMARREFFEKIGGFDENYFMYFEDVDLCRRAKRMGYRVMINPAARVFHESGKSFASEREKKKHYYASQDYYLRKHFGPAWAGAVKLLRLPYYAKNVWLNQATKY